MCPLTGCGPDRKGKPAGSTLACLSLTKTASVNKPSDLCTHTTTTRILFNSKAATTNP